MTPFDKEHTQRAARAMAQQGMEETPDEALRLAKAAMETIRRELRAQGIAVPDSDEQMFLLLKASGW